MGELQNKDMAIRYFCKEEDIILEMESGDRLVGFQVLNLINTLFQKEKENWLIYFKQLLNK